MKKNISLKDYIVGYYLPFYRSKIRKQFSYSKELARIKIILKDHMACLPMVFIDEFALVSFLERLASARKIKKSTVNRYHSRLNALFNHALKNKVIETNPMKYIKKHREYARSAYLSERDIKKLLLECGNSKNQELYIITALALHTGMRQGEILNLKRRDIVGNNIVLEEDKTKSGLARVVPMNDTIMELFKKYTKNKNIEDGLFKSKDIRCAFHNAMERAGIKGIRFHDLRRTFATALKDGNVNIHDISVLLGHSNISTTERYLGVDEKKLLDSVQILRFI